MMISKIILVLKTKFFFIIDLLTCLSIYLLGKPSHIRLSVGLRCQGKEIHPIPYDQEVCPRNLHTI